MNTPITHFFDLETSEFSKRVANTARSQDLLGDFLRLSATPAELVQHPLFQAHAKSQILQIYASGGIFTEGDHGWVKPYDGMRRWAERKHTTGRYHESDFAARHRLYDQAIQHGVAYEHERVAQFYKGLETSIARSPGQAVVLAGHHIYGFDLWRTEYATYQHESLAPWRGWLAKQAQAGALQFWDTDEDLLLSALELAQVDPEFASQHFVNQHGVPATTLEEARFVKGHSVENAANALGVPQAVAHDAFYDTGRNIQVGAGLDRGLVPSEFRQMFPKVHTPKAAAPVVEAVAKKVPLTFEQSIAKKIAEAGGFTAKEMKVLKYGAMGGAAALGLSYWLAHGTRVDRQTQLTGLPDDGLAADVRHKMTSFGSGYRGLDAQPNPFQLESEQAYSPTLRVLGAGVVGGVGYLAHHQALAHLPNYASTLMRWAKNFEERSPARIGRTFGISERLSAYMAGVDEPVVYGVKEIFAGDKVTLSKLGQALQNQIGIDRLDLSTAVTDSTPLRFERPKGWEGRSHIPLTSHGGYETHGIATMHMTAGGRLTGTAMRLDAATTSGSIERSSHPNIFKRWYEDFRAVRASQRVNNNLPKHLADLKYQPFHTQLAPQITDEIHEPLERATAWWKNAWSRMRVEMLEAFERPQRMFADIGLGLRAGSWNSASSLVGGMLTKRVLPIVLGATALKYVDYRLGHLPSNALINLPLKANVLRADLTDMLPGGRSVTDFYEDTVPGPQYGPAALPLAGGFAGGLYHYQKVLRGQLLTDELRNASARVIPEFVPKDALANLRAIGKHLTSTDGLATIWKKLGAPGKGAAIGLAAMLPFVPGMLGSRKTGAELRDIYSGQEPVPVRSGRWWELGCQAPDNQHLTPNGVCSAKQVYDQHLTVLNGKGEFEEPTAWLSYHYADDLIGLIVAGQPHEQQFTVNHTLPVLREGVRVDLRVDEVRAGDFVLMSRLRPAVTSHSLTISDWVPALIESKGRLYRRQRKASGGYQPSGKWSLPLTLNMDYEMGLLFGHYVAEGNLNSSPVRGLRGVEHVGSLDELNFLLGLQDTYLDRFGVNAVLYKSESNCYRLRVAAGCVADLFAALFHPVCTGDKVLNLEFLQQMSAEFLAGLLEGWFYGDGSFQRYSQGRVTRASIKTEYLVNAVAVQKTLSAFGVAGLIRPYSQTFAVDYKNPVLAGKTFTGYQVAFSLEGLANLSEQGVAIRKGVQPPYDGYAVESGTRRCVVTADEIGFQVLEVNRTFYDGLVYDFTIASDHHYEVLGFVTHNSTPYEGGRIKEWRPHKSVLLKARAETKSLWGSEKEAWRHNPILHPIRWLRDPYALEKQHYADRPYPVASPAFSNVPLIGPLLAATIGKIIKPPVRMHEDVWSGEDYSLYSTRLEPKGPDGVAPPFPKDEFGLFHALKQEAGIFAEYTGLYGFVAQSGYNALLPDYDKGREAFFQGSRQMSNFSRRYYEQEMGAGVGPSASFKEHFGYTEPFRRFVQRDSFTPQANEIKNEMPSWLPGDDYFVNFQVGDPYTRIDDGYARLPGAGYEAVHPELEGVAPEDYPDIHKLAILADVAPYSREFNTMKQVVGGQASEDTELRIEYEKILERVRQTKDSVIRMDQRQFTAPIEEIDGTVTSASPAGLTLEEYPGRTFHFSSIGMNAADMTATILGENNRLTREQAAAEVDYRHGELLGYLEDHVLGKRARLTVPKDAVTHNESVMAVVEVGGTNINRALIDEGYARYRGDRGGAETRAMHGVMGRAVGAAAEHLSFEGDEGVLNPLRYIPSPAHTKVWQERTALSQYIAQEVAGTRMRRWHRPIHDFVGPYLRGAAERLTGRRILPRDAQFRRDLNTLADTLQYLRGKVNPAYTSQSQRTSVGANMFASPIFVASTLPDRETHYFQAFLRETDPDKRAEIMAAASPEMRRALTAQWVAQEAKIAQAEGRMVESIGEGGRPFDEESVQAYTKAKTSLGYGDYLRSKEIADFFSRTGFALPDPDSPVWDGALDYEDVKLKIVQQEGYDAHDFNLFDDRAAVLWRKPYVDGAVRELTSGRQRDPEQLRSAVEQMLLASKNRNAEIRSVVQASRQDRSSVRVNVDLDEQDAMLRDMRRNPEHYEVH